MLSIRSRRWLRWRFRTWPLAAAAALVAGVLAATAVSRAEQAAGDLGERRTMPVATRTLEVGHEVGPGDVDWEERPVGLVSSPVVDDPVGRIVSSPVLTGEPLVSARLAPDGMNGPMALAPPGSRVVWSALGPAAPRVAPGDRVDVLAVGPADPSRTGRWVARRAIVVEVADETVGLAVDVTEAAAVAAAALTGGIALVAVAPG